jgi:hypothetical protein
VERLRASGEPDASARELRALLRRLPRRPPLRPQAAEADVLDSTPADTDAEERVRAAEDASEHERVRQALDRALAQLSVEDRVLLRLRFWEGSSVADIARALGVPQKPLYRRLERTLVVLRRELEVAGVGLPDVLELLDGHELEGSDAWGRAPPGPAAISNGTSESPSPRRNLPSPHPPMSNDVRPIAPPASP